MFLNNTFFLNSIKNEIWNYYYSYTLLKLVRNIIIFTILYKVGTQKSLKIGILLLLISEKLVFFSCRLANKVVLYVRNDVGSTFAFFLCIKV